MKHINPEDTILSQTQHELECWSKGDTEGYGKFASDDITYFHNVPAKARIDGIQAFRKFMTALKGQIPPHRYKIVNPKLQMYGDVAIYSLEYHALLPDGKPLALGRGTCVYHHSGENWKMVHNHWSMLEEA